MFEAVLKIYEPQARPGKLLHHLPNPHRSSIRSSAMMRDGQGQRRRSHSTNREIYDRSKFMYSF
jgi:hypothetical protein